MMTLDPNFRELLRLLNSAGVRFMVLGGYAVNFHGYHRNTADIDIWIAFDPENLNRVVKALHDFGIASVGPTTFTKRGDIIRFGRQPLRVDILTNPTGIEFENCFPRKVEAEFDGVLIPFIALEDLKVNKKAAGRLKDLADIEGLP